jgi:diaminopimelate epimerase
LAVRCAAICYGPTTAHCVFYGILAEKPPHGILLPQNILVREMSMRSQLSRHDYRVTLADPAGNITALVEAAPASDEETVVMQSKTPDDGTQRDIVKSVPVALWTDAERQDIARRIRRDNPSVEQTGFVIPDSGGLWRLEMAGREFCGNAARSFGLFVARKQGLAGRAAVSVAVSGIEGALTVFADTENDEAEIALPPPRNTGRICYQGSQFPAVMFDGITHVIIEGIDKNRDQAALAKMFFEVKHVAAIALKGETPAAFGVMFYDTAHGFLRPAVFVNGLDSFVFENSCGSGSAAFAYHRARHFPDGEYCLDLPQPGGTIKTRVVKEHGKSRSLFIGGKVFFH